MGRRAREMRIAGWGLRRGLSTLLLQVDPRDLQPAQVYKVGSLFRQH